MAFSWPLLALFLAGAAPEVAPPPRVAVLTTALEVRRLSVEEANLKQLVRIEGVITHVSPVVQDFFVQDRTAGIYVHPTPLSVGLKQGDRVRVEGESDSGSFSPCIRARSVARLGTADLPEPHPYDLERDDARWLDGQFVQVLAVVKSVNPTANGVTGLRVFTPKGTGLAVIPTADTEAARKLVKAPIRIRGVLVAGFNKTTREVDKAPVIFLAGIPERVPVPAGRSPSETPPRLIDHLRQFVPDPPPAPRQVRAVGVVTASPRDDLLFIADETAGLAVHLDDKARLAPGTQVEVTGLLEIHGRRIALTQARYTVVGSGPVPKPHPITSQDLPDGNWDGRRVEIDGQIESVTSGDGRVVLSVRSGVVVFDALVQGTEDVGRFPLQEQVRLVGVPRKLGDGLELMVQSADDVTVVQPPSWPPFLTRDQAIWLGLALAGVTALIAGSIITLRVRLRRLAEQIRKQLEHETELEARYRDLFEGAGDAVWVTDREGRIVALNRAGEALLGLTRDEAAGRKIAEFIPPDEAGLARASQVSRLGAPYELTVLPRSGPAAVVEVGSQVLPDGGVQTIARDVTERKRLQDRAHRVQKLEAIGRLAGGIAHDFNNLLTVINGSSEILRDRLPAGTPTRALAEEVLDAGNRAANLTRQLLAFSRQRFVSPTPLDLNEVVSGTAGLLRRLIGEEVTLVTELAPDAPWVLAEAGLVEQVLMNLAVNARDAMPKGGTLTVRTAKAPGGLARLTVTDTGVGMDEATQARVFEPFFTTKPVGQGTGLGLATVYGVVQTLGGVIRFTSERGRGTVFEVDLPALAERDGAAVTSLARPSLAEPTPLPNSIGTWGKPYTVLLVEDDEAVRGLAQNILEEQGLTVLVAADGPAALAVCRERADAPLHLLITDVMMPGMTGAELASEVLAERPGLKVLFVSGYTADEEPWADGPTGRWDFVHKPFTPAELTGKVREVLRRTDATPALRE